MKKVLAIMLVFASVFAFAACAGKEDTAATTAATVAQTQATTVETAKTTKISAVAGKTILLKSIASQNFVEIHTNSDGIATVMKIHKFYVDDAAFNLAVASGDHGTYKIEVANEATREIIFSDSETVNGMTYDEIIKELDKREDYMLIPEA